VHPVQQQLLPQLQRQEQGAPDPPRGAAGAPAAAGRVRGVAGQLQMLFAQRCLVSCSTSAARSSPPVLPSSRRYSSMCCQAGKGGQGPLMPGTWMAKRARADQVHVARSCGIVSIPSITGPASRQMLFHRLPQLPAAAQCLSAMQQGVQQQVARGVLTASQPRCSTGPQQQGFLWERTSHYRCVVCFVQGCPAAVLGHDHNSTMHILSSHYRFTLAPSH
jgi:hypothetical protein